jgi:hypothetical protein
MLTVYELKEKMGRDWWRNNADLAADIEELGYEVIEGNMEWLTFYDPRESDDLQYTLRLGGITHITINRREIDEV